jgi:hypothetical protein
LGLGNAELNAVIHVHFTLGQKMTARIIAMVVRISMIGASIERWIEIPDEIPIAPGAIYRYYYPGDSQDHICTVAPNELGTGSIDGYRFEGILGYAETTQKPGTIPLYRYVNDGKNDHLLASNWNELGEGCCGYKLEGIIGYVYTQQENGTVPIRRYFSGRGHDHMCSTDPNEFGEGREGYKREGIVGYIWTKPPSKR